jgi:solute carrier family 13 (sodium-dependent dicarboxylate transporter), member 2/3/5
MAAFPIARVSTAAAPRRRPRTSSVAAVAVACALTALLIAPGGPPFEARAALAVFALAVFAWVATRADDTYVALAAALVLALIGAVDADALPAALGDPTVWLLLAAFVVAAAVRACGLSTRLAAVVAGRARTVTGLFVRLSAVLGATAFVIPSTSGRAALMVPVFTALSGAIGDRRIVRALALLIPSIILLSAVASLLGAGAHLVTAQIVAQTGHGEISFARWALLGTPFAVVSCALTCWLVLRLFLRPDERTRPLDLSEVAAQARGGLSGPERRVAAVVATLVALWAAEPLHGIDATLLALAGALVVTAPAVGAVPFRDALAAVDWNILLFLAATLVLGRALVDSGAAQWLAGGALQAVAGGAGTLVVVGAVAAVSLLAHLVVTSRTARSSVLVPIVVALGAASGLDPAALAFLSTAAAGFCLTLPVSAKPVLMFSRLDGPTFDPADLWRLSRVSLPAHLVLLVVFAVAVWPALGLPL